MFALLLLTPQGGRGQIEEIAAELAREAAEKDDDTPPAAG